MWNDINLWEWVVAAAIFECANAISFCVKDG